MKNLKIRFIKSGNRYYMQYRSWWRWTSPLESTKRRPGVRDFTLIYGATKSKCLNKSLNKMQICKQYVKITEYPTIKKY